MGRAPLALKVIRNSEIFTGGQEIVLGRLLDRWGNTCSRLSRLKDYGIG